MIVSQLIVVLVIEHCLLVLTKNKPENSKEEAREFNNNCNLDDFQHVLNDQHLASVVIALHQSNILSHFFIILD